MSEDYERPLCPHCEQTITQLAVWTDERNLSAIFFCPACGKAFGAQFLRNPAPGEGEEG